MSVALSGGNQDDSQLLAQLERTVFMVGVDLSRPWSMDKSLQCWSKLLNDLASRVLQKLPPNTKDALLARQVHYLARCYNILSQAPGDTAFTIKPLGGDKGTNGSTSSSSNGTSNGGLTTAAEDTGPLPQLAPGVLQVNMGVPLVVVGLKADLVKTDTFEEEQKAQFLQQYLRRFCLQHGAALVYTSSISDANVNLLHRYLLHR